MRWLFILTWQNKTTNLMWLCECPICRPYSHVLTKNTRGDTFVILSRARGWWVVQRDPSGSGILDTDTSKQGWVPAGCLLETNVPVASAIAEANAAKALNGLSSPPASPSAARTPILPLSIISTSFPGVALMDYKKKGEEELDLVKDDPLRVFKRYNHWSYVRVLYPAVTCCSPLVHFRPSKKRVEIVVGYQ